MGKITQDTLIPLGLAVIIIGTASGWVMRQELLTEANAADISALSQTYRVIGDKLEEILERLSGIEGELRRIPKRQRLPER